MAIARNINGVIDYLLEQAEEIDARSYIELEKKIKMTDQIFRNVWKGAALNLQHKHLMLRAPDIAANKSAVLQLGSGAEDKPAKVEPIEAA